MPLESATDLKALSMKPDPNNASQMLSYAELAVARMQSVRTPMPPGGPTPTQTRDIAAIQSWIDTGYPGATCSGAP
jgi:hypothetical protein